MQTTFLAKVVCQSLNPLSTWQHVEKNVQAFHHLPELCSSTQDIAGVAYLKYTIHSKKYKTNLF